jgi:hypothetical protein
MTDQTLHLSGIVVHLCANAGPLIESERDVSDLVGDAFSAGAALIAIPLARLSPDFLVLSTRVAGEILQKLVNYRFRVAVLGDVSQAVAGSDALRDFVRESNRGQAVWFVQDLAALEEKLAMNGR